MSVRGQPMVAGTASPAKAARSANPDPGKALGRLKRNRAILYAGLIVYPFLLPLFYQSAQISVGGLAVLAVLVTLAVACIGPVCGFWNLSLIEQAGVEQAGVTEQQRRAVGREALLGAVGVPLFVILNNNLGLLGWSGARDPLWWGIIGLVFAAGSLPARKGRYQTELGLRKIHIAASVLMLVYGVAHVANHLFALHSFELAERVQNVLRQVYLIPVLEILLMISAAAIIATGTRLVIAATNARSTLLRNLQVISGAYLAVFLLGHITNIVVVDRIWRELDMTFRLTTTGGPLGMLSNPSQPRLFAYYFLSVIALFVHVGAASRWMLVPVLGRDRSERFAYATMAAGVIAALALLLPMANIHFSS